MKDNYVNYVSKTDGIKLLSLLITDPSILTEFKTSNLIVFVIKDFLRNMNIKLSEKEVSIDAEYFTSNL